eukprot:4394132-Pyramimonas_sp.AAC.1
MSIMNNNPIMSIMNNNPTEKVIPVLTIAAAMSGQSIFMSPMDKREAADAAKRALAGVCVLHFCHAQ